MRVIVGRMAELEMMHTQVAHVIVNTTGTLILQHCITGKGAVQGGLIDEEGAI
jgi:hypothetical protein